MMLFPLAGTCGSRRMENIGGLWFIQHVPTLPESGIKPRNLIRESGGRRFVVDELIEYYRYYEPDCIIYQTARKDHDVFVVCGDRTPIAIASSMVIPWRLDADALSRTRGRAVRDGVLSETVEALLIEEVKALAMRQPPYREDWKRSAASFNPDAPPIRPIERPRPVDMKATDRWGNVPLLDTVRSGRVDLVDAALRAGADVNSANENGLTALMIAAGKGNKEIVDRLIVAGANVDARNRYGVTALMAAADVGETEVVRLLLRSGADVGIRDAEGRTAAERIPASQNRELLEVLRNAAAKSASD